MFDNNLYLRSTQIFDFGVLFWNFCVTFSMNFTLCDCRSPVVFAVLKMARSECQVSRSFLDFMVIMIL